jgi:hypothetical protein
MSTDRAPKSLPIGYVEKKFMDGLPAFIECLRSTDVRWALGGDLADAMRGVDLSPEFAEIYTDKHGAATIHDAVRTYHPSELKLVEQRLPRDADVGGKPYPIYVRSHFFEVTVKNAPLRVHGDLQYKVGEWPWGDVVEFNPEPLSLVGEMLNIVPMNFRLDLYRSLGWKDKVDAINVAIMKSTEHLPGLE